MIISKMKPLEEILSELQGIKKVAIIGCANCAAACAVGGAPECESMKQKLQEQGFEVVATVLPEESCVYPYAKKAVREAVRSGAEAVVSLSCGSGVQTVAENATVPVYTGTNTLFVGQIVRAGMFRQMCRTCGECLLNYTGGICPITKCAKSLINGPCGGARNGKCEVNPENDCAWVSIYGKLKELGQLNKLEKVIPERNYSQHCWPESRNLKEEG